MTRCREERTENHVGGIQAGSSQGKTPSHIEVVGVVRIDGSACIVLGLSKPKVNCISVGRENRLSLCSFSRRDVTAFFETTPSHEYGGKAKQAS